MSRNQARGIPVWEIALDTDSALSNLTVYTDIGILQTSFGLYGPVDDIVSFPAFIKILHAERPTI